MSSHSRSATKTHATARKRRADRGRSTKLHIVKPPADATPQRRADGLTPLVVDREQAAFLLHISIETILRMEKEGVLTPLKLRAKRGAKVQFSMAEIEKLAATGALAGGE